MNPFERKMQTRLKLHPQMLRSLLAEPNPEALDILVKYRILEDRHTYLAEIINSLLPNWEYYACEGDISVAKLMKLLETTSLSPVSYEDENLKANLQRIRILAETPGVFPFSPFFIQENLTKLLKDAAVLANLPQMEVISFKPEEIEPLAADLTSYQLSPHSRRYFNNLFHPQRQEAILTVLAHIAKNYPLLSSCRQAYALLLSLDDKKQWCSQQFCVQLVANRFWEYKLSGEL